MHFPSVSVIVPNWNGAEHLGTCLDSIGELDYPPEKLEVIVVDNGSTDASRSLIDLEHPQVRLVALEENRGFSVACNRGAEASDSDCVAFLNNDMRVDPGWLRALVDAYAPADGYVCVAGVILDWEGKHLDFAGGWIPFYGSAGQEHFLDPMREDLVEDGRDLVFACGGSMLISRELFLELRGFDPKYFAFHEDVDLGWRLWLAGYKVRLAGASRSFHRHHSTGSGIPLFRRMLLYERNALTTLIKNVGDENLATVLAPSLLLLAMRSSRSTKSARAAFELNSADAAESETVSREGLAGIHAVAELLDDLPDLLERRRDVQRRRKRSDEEIFGLFGRPFASVLNEEGYLETSLTLHSAFGLDRVFTRQRATRVLVVDDEGSERLAAFATYAAIFSDASLVAPGKDGELLSELLAESDLVIVPAETVHGAMIAAQTAGLLVVDVAGGPAVDPDLKRRADVFLEKSRDVRAAPIEQLLVVDEDGDLTPLRDLLQRPWRHTAAEEIAVPEDLQQLLRVWREHYKGGGRTKGAARTVLHWLPGPIERSVRRLLGRPQLTG